MSDIYLCELCKKAIDVDNDNYVAYDHRTEMAGSSQERLVHSACLEEYEKKFPYSRAIGGSEN
jgi:hypothetical protein